ncbi:MAG TPA: type I-U CRISPR-associated protein Csb2 [Bryobacteraceae bacterium]|nr:type I-U CRISPR-associated protein Csb2 [Bryobacteraceae bacterium]
MERIPTLPSDAFQPAGLAQPGPGGSPIDAVLLRLDSPVLPLATAALEIAERLRTKLMGIHKRLMGDGRKVSPLFSGKTHGAPNKDHLHLYIFPGSKDQVRIDRILLVSPKRPFRLDELQAVHCLHSLWQSEGRPDIKCVVAGQGSSDQLRCPAKKAVSVTPFVAPRHSRRGRGVPWLLAEVRRECRNHGLPEPISIEPMPSPPGVFQWIEFRRCRKNGPSRPGYGFRLQFAQKVMTPFSIGYGAHFGLGQFAAEES